MSAYFDIVGDLYEIVELGPRSDHCRPHRGPVYGGIRADLYHIFHHHISDLGDFFETAIGLWRKTKPVAADH